MTKAVMCLYCGEITGPASDWRNNKAWRWCEPPCGMSGVRWRDGAAGDLEVTHAQGPSGIAIMGFNNAFIADALGSGMHEDHRLAHQQSTQTVPEHYLFHKDKRDCWAVLIKVGQTGDVHWVPYADAKGLA